ncbi:MAG: amidohydrolase family protein [Anaerolineaceae bacterium]|nr:amidohydrolase family protein [Anaerolineaceae bacterium]
MELESFRPIAQLKTKTTVIQKPRFQVIDAHNHLAEPFGGGWDEKPLSALLDNLDEAGVVHYIDLDGGWGEEILNQHLDYFKQPVPERFTVFGGVDWLQWQILGDAFPEWAAKRLLAQKDRGAQGLKIWKALGLSVQDHNQQLVAVDDCRLDPIWQTAADLSLPVLIHVGDPVAFFEPLNEHNERWEELHEHPDWIFTSPPFPPFMSIMQSLANLVSTHPQTTFIGAHVGCYAENLIWVSDLLRRCPNFHVDISGRIGELGRQPYSARKFFLEFSDRILFGLDVGPEVNSYRISYRFLETDDEYFNYNDAEIPLQGRWHVHGLYLPDEVLRQVYYQNAERIILGRRI